MGYNIIRSTHGILRALRNFSRFRSMKVWKSLAEALVLSKLNYYHVVYPQMPMYLIKRLQRIQNTTARYAFSRYATIYNVIYLLWLPIIEHIKYNTIKLVQKYLHSELRAKQSLVKLAEKRKTWVCRHRNWQPSIGRKTLSNSKLKYTMS